MSGPTGDSPTADGDEIFADGPLIRGTEPLLALAGGREVLTDSELLTRVDQLLTAAVEVLGVDTVGLMLLDDRDRLHRVGATDEIADLLERAQAESGEGPGVESQRTGAAVAVADLSTSDRYPLLQSRVQGSGIRAVLSSPVRVDQQTIGNLNAVLLRAHTWTEPQLRANQAYADVIGLALKTVAQARATAGRVNRLQRQLGGSSRSGAAGEQDLERPGDDVEAAE
ncbi:hypothetical protein GCM10011575_42980 [Microlunatus endophyticus]|uniref:GAF domain-containing protein n=1 Tax=Microlunatus endophyticus TaxID=1716077 RepID=A0A917SGF5_9ACTN|nr:GAF domain-containing protein [Microlunatus endophyticus]GGL80129.1 hypothetical protein GCM10011575_42980 [Microlunatus endophyticus]